eukprot:6187656-Pleurochrysis_carterae.AAC.2
MGTSLVEAHPADLWPLRTFATDVRCPICFAVQRMLDVFVTPLYDVDADAVAPHGLVGQSFDGDGLAVDGKRDERLTLGEDEEVTTEAQVAQSLRTSHTLDVWKRI